ncbi:unnamed protein product [Blepharisma stoltei]|uniref:Uncharacterized protein n=1 Tax=Blepharisma stoltei TaxID=1481888 RepID=A0AAU9I7R9_9CILI|nr:unnamed protein product [Blepharisma stoltei]
MLYLWIIHHYITFVPFLYSMINKIPKPRNNRIQLYFTILFYLISYCLEYFSHKLDKIFPSITITNCFVLKDCSQWNVPTYMFWILYFLKVCHPLIDFCKKIHGPLPINRQTLILSLAIVLIDSSLFICYILSENKLNCTLIFLITTLSWSLLIFKIYKYMWNKPGEISWEITYALLYILGSLMLISSFAFEILTQLFLIELKLSFLWCLFVFASVADTILFFRLRKVKEKWDQRFIKRFSLHQRFLRLAEVYFFSIFSICGLWASNWLYIELFESEMWIFNEGVYFGISMTIAILLDFQYYHINTIHAIGIYILIRFGYCRLIHFIITICS